MFGFLAAKDAGRVAASLPTPYNGLEERVNIFGYLLWAAVLAIGLLRAPDATPPPREERPQLIPQEIAR